MSKKSSNTSARLQRLETQLQNLAKDQLHLREQISVLADQLDHESSTPPQPASATSPPTIQDAAWRAAAGGDIKSLLRSILRRARALWTATDPVRVEAPLLAIDPNGRANRPSLGIVLQVPSREEARHLDGFAGLEQQTYPGDAFLFWDRKQDHLRIETPTGHLQKTVSAKSEEDVRRISAMDYLLTFRASLGEAEPTVLELALLALAIEPLPLLEIPVGLMEPLLIVQSDLWSEQGLNRTAFKRRVNKREAVLGKILPPQGTRAWFHRVDLDRGWRQAGAYLVSDPRRGKARQTLHPPTAATWPGVDAPPESIILVDSLTGGVERFLADRLRQTPNQAIVLLQPSDPLTIERIDALSELTRWIYPLGDRLPNESRIAALDSLRQRFGIDRILDLRPSSSPSLPDLPTFRLSGAPSAYCQIDPRIRKTKETRLVDLPGDQLVISQVEDLISAKRPEDFVALARHLREDDRFFFILAGRGPLAGSLEDLARFFTLPNFRLITGATASEVLNSSDVVCSMAESDPFPYSLLEARAAKLPVLAPCLNGETPVEIGDWEGWRRALEGLVDRAVRSPA